MRRTKSVATLGPASDTPEVLHAMIESGVDVVRLGLAYGAADEHRRRMEQVRAAAERYGRTVAVLADLPGPKVRTGTFPDGGVVLSPGDEVALVAGEGPSDGRRIEVDEARLTDTVASGDTVVIGDGVVTLEVVAVGHDPARPMRRCGAWSRPPSTGGSWRTGRRSASLPGAPGATPGRTDVLRVVTVS